MNLFRFREVVRLQLNHKFTSIIDYPTKRPLKRFHCSIKPCQVLTAQPFHLPIIEKSKIFVPFALFIVCSLHLSPSHGFETPLNTCFFAWLILLLILRSFDGGYNERKKHKEQEERKEAGCIVLKRINFQFSPVVVLLSIAG